MAPADAAATEEGAGRVEALLTEANSLRRDAISLQREGLAMQREALDAQCEMLVRTRENLDLAKAVNDGAAQMQQKARRVLAILLPVVVLLIGYVSWLLFFKLRI